MSKFRVQLAAVVALVLVVGWPRFRPLPELTVWATHATAPQPELVARDARVRAAEADAESQRAAGQQIGRWRRTTNGADSGASSDGSAWSKAYGDDGPQDLASTGAKFNAIVGRARTLTNQPVPYARVLLRNTRTGLVEARVTSDQEGRFTFLDVPQSGYVIELVGADGSVIASSELVAVSNGDMRQATVRVAANSTVRAVFGSTAVAPTVQQAIQRAVESSTREVSQTNNCVSSTTSC